MEFLLVELLSDVHWQDQEIYRSVIPKWLLERHALRIGDG